MRLLLRLACIIGGALAIAYAVDGLSINTEPRSFTIEEVETSGVGDARYVIVTGGESTGAHVAINTYLAGDSANKSTTGAIIPVFSRNRLAENADNARPPTSLLYSLEGTNGCLMDKTCGEATAVSVKGVIKHDDWSSIVTSYREVHYPRTPNFIFVADGEPMPWAIYLLIIGIGGIFLILGFLPTHLFSKYVTGS